MVKILMKHRRHIFMNVDVKSDAILSLFVFIFTIASGLIPSISSILTGKVFDLLANILTMEKDELLSQLTVKSMSLMALGAATIPVMWLSISAWMSIGETQSFRIRRTILLSYLKKPMEWFDENDQLLGDFVQMHRCVEEVRSGSAEASAITFQNFVAIIALVCTSFYYSWSLTLIILCSSPLLIVLAAFFSRMIENFTKLENDETGIAAQSLTWSMNAAQLVKLYCTQDFEIKKFKEIVIRCNDYFINAWFYVSANTSILRFLSLAMFVQGFWFGSTMIKKNKMSVDQVITCFSSCLMLGSILNTTLPQIVLLQKAHVGLNRVQDFLEDKSEMATDRDRQTSINLDNVPISISFDAISFCYPSRPDDMVLKNISMNFDPNKTTFIVGKSGSGKSTMSNLLLKFYNGYNGCIKVNGVNVQSIDRHWITKNVTLVEQKCTLFNDTLRNNLLIGLSHISAAEDVDSRLQEACRFALLDNVIEKLPSGLDTKVGSGGVSLSGGQQQRVALARAYLRDTPVVILDEAISALDARNRRQLMENIRIWTRSKTAIILTHELNQILPSDFLYLMENGQIKEEGYQNELIENVESTFCKFFHLQNSNRESESLTTISSTTERSSSEKFIQTQCRKDATEVQEKLSKDLESSSSGSYTAEETVGTVKSNETLGSDIETHLKSTGNEDAEPIEITPLKTIICRMLRTVRYRKTLLLGVISAIIAGIANPVFSFTFSYLLDGIVPKVDGVGSSHYLLKWSVIVLCVAFTDGISTFLKSFSLGFVSENWIMDLRNKAMESITNKELEWFYKDENKSSELAALVLNDLRDLRSLISEFISAMSTFIVVSLAGLIWALTTGWKLSLVCIAMFPLIILFSAIYGSILQRYETTYKTTVADLENCVYEIMLGIKTIRCLQLEQHFIQRYSVLEARMKHIGRKRAIATGFGIAITTALVMCIEAILFYYGLKLVFIGEYTTMKMFKTFTLLLFTIMTCTSLINQIPDVTRGQRAASRIFRILDESDRFLEDSDEHGRTRGIPKNNSIKSIITINNLQFHYPSAESSNVFNRLNLQIADNQTVAVVAESGSGKSTLLYLLTRLYKVDFNSIFIDGTDINEWQLTSLRNLIAIVEQKPTLFEGSIRKNLIYGNKLEIMDMDIYDVLKQVGIFDFVTSLPNGIDTNVDTSLLSGGQAQRICIARALLRKSKILILDECTSALDAESAFVIQNLVKSGLPGVLTIAITHSEPMMRACGNVIVLQDGETAQQGTFDELYKPGNELHRIVIAHA
ncbi:hypothetical protein KAFR_0E00230 [Kazachstania africana CBS 2517]|uniref:Uncharacterized protein n=1 Tax=Kazachstania africana (strain ATCC 22294 / BCRC 22015 / CBS 2517 / CECT 1963 / NBRC 1671 / NRRL Y-8276) TaxID=1071382 RepID=H2AUX7_KAZAF|nr:hypothetical protein KAFR_0E00230 [Kazachstania africana CBS 2517]CCF58177.1 hypothetical protein KAFR_0E00230 [Kazachstania africana CBS 2517]